jgi:glucosylceramidase
MKKLATLGTFAGISLAYLSAGCGSGGEPVSPGAGGSVTPSVGGAAAAGGSPSVGGASGSGGAIGAGGGGGVPSGGQAGVGGAVSPAGGAGPAAGGTNGSGGGGGEPPVVERPGLVTSGVGTPWVVGTLADAAGAATVTVSPSPTAEQWRGFGGTVNEMGWDALSVLSAEDRALAIKLLFSPTEGANLAWIRIPIGASDYAMDRYTLNETPGDYQMTNFSIARDEEMLIPYIQAAQAVKPNVKFWASPWTPPSWMKDSGKLDGTDAPPSGGNGTFTSHMKEDAQTLDAFALYLTKWIQAYQAKNIPIDHVYPQNEPGYATRYPSCLWSTNLMSTFIETHLSKAFADNNITTKIWFGTLSNADTDPAMLTAISTGAAGHVEGAGFQWNTMSSIQTALGKGFLAEQTEHKCGNYPWNSTAASSVETADYNNFLASQAPNNHNYAVESWGLIRDWIKAKVSSYSAWNMVLDTQGKNLDVQRPWPQNALLVVDRAGKQLIQTPTYFVFRHLSYFVDPGAFRVDVTGGDALAFKNPDGSTAVVLFNSGNATKNEVVSLAGKTVSAAVPARGWATVYVKGS